MNAGHSHVTRSHRTSGVGNRTVEAGAHDRDSHETRGTQHNPEYLAHHMHRDTILSRSIEERTRLYKVWRQKFTGLTGVNAERLNRVMAGNCSRTKTTLDEYRLYFREAEILFEGLRRLPHTRFAATIRNIYNLLLPDFDLRIAKIRDYSTDEAHLVSYAKCLYHRFPEVTYSELSACSQLQQFWFYTFEYLWHIQDILSFIRQFRSETQRDDTDAAIDSIRSLQKEQLDHLNYVCNSRTSYVVATRTDNRAILARSVSKQPVWRCEAGKSPAVARLGLSKNGLEIFCDSQDSANFAGDFDNYQPGQYFFSQIFVKVDNIHGEFICKASLHMRDMGNYNLVYHNVSICSQQDRRWLRNESSYTTNNAMSVKLEYPIPFNPDVVGITETATPVRVTGMGLYLDPPTGRLSLNISTGLHVQSLRCTGTRHLRKLKELGEPVLPDVQYP